MASRVIAENAPIAPNLWMPGMIDPARATVIIDQAPAQGRTLGLPPLTAGVLDAGGRVIPVPGGVLIPDTGADPAAK